MTGLAFGLGRKTSVKSAEMLLSMRTGADNRCGSGRPEGENF